MQGNNLFELVKDSERITWSLDDTWETNLTNNLNHYLNQKRHISSKNKQLAIRLKNILLDKDSKPTPLEYLDTIQKLIPTRGWNLKPSFLFKLSTFAKNMHTVHKDRSAIATKTQDYYRNKEKKAEENTQKLNEDVSSKESNLKAKDRQIDALSQRNRELEEEVTVLRTKNGELTTEVSTLTTENKEAKKKFSDLFKEKQEQTKENLGLKSKNTDLEKENQTLKKKSERKKSQAQLSPQDVRTTDIPKLISTNQDFEQDVQRLSVANATLKDENKNQQTEIDNYKNQIKKLEREKEEAKTKAERALEDVNIISQTAESAQKEAQQYKNENAILKKTLEKVKSWIHSVFGKHVTGTTQETFDMIKDGTYTQSPLQIELTRSVAMAGRIGVPLDQIREQVSKEKLAEIRKEAIMAKPPSTEDRAGSVLSSFLSRGR